LKIEKNVCDTEKVNWVGLGGKIVVVLGHPRESSVSD